MSWLDMLLKQTEENEAPERYFWWSGLAAISAVVRKNVWLDKYYYKLYPNIYVALISAKSGTKKGIPISVCKRLLEHVDLTRIISGCNSIQGMIQELSGQKKLKNGAIISDAHGIMLSDELDTFLLDDPKALSTLTQLHNTHEHEIEWKKTLKNSDPAILRSPCLTMLVASNQALFDGVVKKKDIQGGFIARTFIVYESRIGNPNALVYPPKHRLDITGLSERLVEISKIKGEFKWTEIGGKIYEEWYNKLAVREDLDDITGSVNRLPDQVLKASMLISLARRNELTLEAEDIVAAIRKCNECVNTAMRIKPPTSGSVNGDRPDAMNLIEKYLREAPNYMISKAVIVTRLHQFGINTYTLNLQIKELVSLGWVKETKDANGKCIYQLTDEGYKNIVGGNFQACS